MKSYVNFRSVGVIVGYKRNDNIYVTCTNNAVVLHMISAENNYKEYFYD